MGLLLKQTHATVFCSGGVIETPSARYLLAMFVFNVMESQKLRDWAMLLQTFRLGWWQQLRTSGRFPAATTLRRRS